MLEVCRQEMLAFHISTGLCTLSLRVGPLSPGTHDGLPGTQGYQDEAHKLGGLYEARFQPLLHRNPAQSWPVPLGETGPDLRTTGGVVLTLYWEDREVVTEARVPEPFIEVCVLTWEASALLEFPGQTW